MSLQNKMNEDQTVSYAYHKERLQQVSKESRALALAEHEASLRSFEAGEVSIKMHDEASLDSKRFVATWNFLGEKHVTDVFVSNAIFRADSEAEIMSRMQELLAKQLVRRVQAMMFKPVQRRVAS